jgi:hypothetical protein
MFYCNIFRCFCSILSDPRVGRIANQWVLAVSPSVWWAPPDAHASVVSSADTEGMSTWILDIVASREEAPVVPREYLNLLEHGWEARQQ